MKITLGPLPYNWPHDTRQDFYLRVADEAAIDTVFLGEITCAHRIRITSNMLDDIVARMESAGKTVVFSTLALPKSQQERTHIAEMKNGKRLVEANDMTAVALLQGRPHTLGPFLSITNEDTLRILAENGAKSACLPFDLPSGVISNLARNSPIPLEIQVFGHASLAISARCFSARSAGRTRETCQSACSRNNGHPMVIHTLEGMPFLSASGPLVLSAHCTNLLREVPQIAAMGISALRIQPEENIPPADIACLIRNILAEKISPEEAHDHAQKLAPETIFCNGFFHNQPGHKDIPS
ncbi:MAG TPA: U32 family peptidase [Rhodospirillaceae bacterium]|nr:MAG: hypothetical protein A2018_08175 [Alphaproteobacteria bacterium GWF2_58_20]HAU29952.1 U32 family peptidase [Rhodospirillaceae bacterium]